MSRKYVLEIEEGAVNILSAALGKLPHEVVNPLILNLQAQINAQDSAHVAAQAHIEAAGPEEKVEVPA
jgi:hypothetical protein